MRVSDFHTSKYIFLIQYLDVQIFYDTSIELKHTTFLKSFNSPQKLENSFISTKLLADRHAP